MREQLLVAATCLSTNPTPTDMKPITLWLVLGAIALILTVAGVVLGQKPRQRVGQYKARRLLTPNEEEFFGRLMHALPEYRVFCQVAMSALLTASSSDRKVAHADRLRIAQHYVDYVVCDAALNVIAVLELDDRTHSKAKDVLRDERLQLAGYRVVRIQSTAKPSAADLRAAIIDAQTAPAATQPKAAAPAPGVVAWPSTASKTQRGRE